MDNRHLLVLLALLLLISLLRIHGEPPSSSSGFLNIDCGKSKGETHIDDESQTKLVYEDDFGYIETGEIHKSSLVSESDTDDLYYDLRFFQNGTKNCYNLHPLRRGGRHLLRAWFSYRDYDGKKSATTRFDVYLGTSRWVEVESGLEKERDKAYEIMFLAKSENVSLCLVNTSKGIPFISGIEVRPLDDGMYGELLQDSQALHLCSRSNVGSNNPVRYQQDKFDRIWKPFLGTGRNLTTRSTISTSSPSDPPNEVMQSALIPEGSLSFPCPTESGIGNQFSTVVTFMHFAEVEQPKANESRTFGIIVDGVTAKGSFTPESFAVTTVSLTASMNRSNFSILLSPATGSTRPPILNAVEIFLTIALDGPETNYIDAVAIQGIKSAYRIKMMKDDWTGDPCYPANFTWTGLSCSEGHGIVSVNLSNSKLQGEISSSFASLTELQYLDLSGNDLNGEVPDSLASLTQLKVLNLARNSLSGSTIPGALLERYRAGQLTINIDGNHDLCNGNLDQCIKQRSNKKLSIAVALSLTAVAFFVGALVVITLRRRRKHRTIDHLAGGELLRGVIGGGGSFREASFRRQLDCRKFTHMELIRITGNFQTPIGKGGFGTVYRGVLESGADVAVKMLSHSSSQGQREFQAEITLLTRIHHRNLVLLFGYCNDANHLALVYEYMVEGSLENHLSGKIGNPCALSWKDRLRIASEAAQGLEYLHNGCKPTIIHRDVKTSNILLTQNLEARIADFGLSKIFQSDGHTHVSTIPMGTPGYLDPECYVTNNLNEKSDVYSFGIVLLELITGLPAIIREPEKIHIAHWVEQRLQRAEIAEIVDARLQGDYDINSVWKALDIAMSCVAPIAIQRPTMSEVFALLKDCFEVEMAHDHKSSDNSNVYDSSGTDSLGLAPMRALMMVNPTSR